MAAASATTCRQAFAVPLEQLPVLDEHSVEIEAPAERTWDELFPALQRTLDTDFARHHTRRLRAIETDAHGDLHHPGGTLPGFVVSRAIEPVMLALLGEHSLSRYALVLRIDLLPGQRSRLRVETRAEFVAGRGRLYRMMLIGSGSHRVLVNRVLRGVKRGAES